MTFDPRPDHRAHDPVLIAAHAAGDLSPDEAATVEVRLSECGECAALHADLNSLSVALASLPKLATAPRDFRISPATAEKLRGGPWWRRFARALTAPRGVGRPLATAFTTLGLVGLLIGSLPAGVLPLAAMTGDRLDTTSTEGAGGPVPAPAASPTDQGQQLYPAQGSGGGRGSDNEYGSAAGASPDAKDGTTAEVRTVRDRASGAAVPVLGLALAFLAVGLGLFAIRRFGRRVT